ncbi:MAG TPA: helix-turn-helix domain-containing protein [Actinomycetes bacterium]|jgi:predicted ArsR family transcriptional regulator|nr:helix-turn-helix domain-containing protein [Actinomycetes bacterium]
MTDDDFATRVSRLSALAEPARRALYRYVAAQPEPVSRDQAGEGVGVPRHTAKFHLDKLVEEGLLTTEFRRLTGRSGPGAGRPTKLYRPSKDEVAVSVPERHYDLAGQLMAAAIESASSGGTDVVAELHRTAAQHGGAVAEALAQRTGARTGRARRLAAVGETLAEHGYQPRLDGDVLTLTSCPFHALAQDHTQLVCGMNLALLGQVAAAAGLTATLDPAPDRCCVVLTADRAAG